MDVMRFLDLWGGGVKIIMYVKKSCHNPVTIIWKYVKVLEKVKPTRELKTFAFWSGRRDLNPRLQPWQGCALPLSYAR